MSVYTEAMIEAGPFVDQGPQTVSGVLSLMRAAILDQEERITASEKRERTAGLHDPSCPWWKRELAQRGVGFYLTPVACACWLNE